MPRRIRRSGGMTGQGRAAGRNERVGGDNPRPTVVDPRDVRRHDWPLTPAGRVMLADVAAACGVNRRATSQVAAVYGVETVPERIPGRRGRPAQTVTCGEADYLAAVHSIAADRWDL